MPFGRAASGSVFFIDIAGTIRYSTRRMNVRCLAAPILLAVLLDARAGETAKPIRVALFDDKGSAGPGIPKVSEQLARCPDVVLTKLSGPQIGDSSLKNAGFDVVIFTGGSGSGQSKTIGETGVAQTRKFVENGGGYIGICAGAYLACEGFSWGVKILDAKTVSSKWKRGHGLVKLEMTDKGREILGLPAGQFDIKYGNGPIYTIAQSPVIPDFEPLAYYRTELAENDTPKGVMVNSPAMVIGTFGKGRVLCSSPHPEQTPGMESFIERAVKWAAGR